MRIRAIVLLLIGLPLLARPAGARAYVECADGTPCGVEISRPSCCRPVPCNRHSDPHRCVVKATTAVDALSPQVAVDHAATTPIALPPIVAMVPPPPLSAATRTVANESPPACPRPKQSCAPRSPPVEQA